MGGGGPSAARDFACVETRFIASHPLGAQPRLGILPSLWAIRAVSDAMNRVATWRTSRADWCAPLQAAWPCALYGTLLMRTPTDVCVLALEMRRDGAKASIHPMDFCFHPMDRPIHPLEISLHGHFSIENGPRFAPYSGEKGPHRGVCGRALRVCASASGGSDFRLFASEGALGRKYSILRVKIERCGRFLSSSRAGCGGGHGYFIASEPFGRGRLPPVLRPTGGAGASGR